MRFIFRWLMPAVIALCSTAALAQGSLEKALEKALPERNHRLIPANIKAIEAGAVMARKQ